MNRTVKIILAIGVVLVLMGASGGAGYALGLRTGTARAQATVQQFINERMGGSAQGTQPFFRQGQGGLFGGTPSPNRQMAGAVGGGLSGVVDKVSEDTIEITMRDQTFAIRLTDQTQIRKSTEGSRADLKAGDTVVITGERAADGTLTARSIQIMTLPNP